MLGDPSRGFLLEHVLTKLRAADHLRSAKLSHPVAHAAAMRATFPPLQIIALSATLPNIEDLKRCLNARFYCLYHTIGAHTVENYSAC